jgi:hypothetical protein
VGGLLFGGGRPPTRVRDPHPNPLPSREREHCHCPTCSGNPGIMPSYKHLDTGLCFLIIVLDHPDKPGDDNIGAG